MKFLTNQARARSEIFVATGLAILLFSASMTFGQTSGTDERSEVLEATIEEIQTAIKSRQLTATDLVSMYLARIKAYNGVCVSQPEGILGPVSPIPRAGTINALITLNLRPAARRQWSLGLKTSKVCINLENHREFLKNNRCLACQTHLPQHTDIIDQCPAGICCVWSWGPEFGLSESAKAGLRLNWPNA